MTILYIICGIALIVSLVADKQKTKKALKAALKMLLNALPVFLFIILFMVILLYFIPPEKIAQVVSKGNNVFGIFIASLVGSAVVLPGFIAFPIAGILKDIGVGYGILAAFTTTLMLVGVLTFPLEKKYFGTKFALYRNVTSYIIAIIVSFVIALVLGGGIR